MENLKEEDNLHIGLTSLELTSGPAKSVKSFITGFALLIISKSQMFLLLGNKHADEYFAEISGQTDFLKDHLKIALLVKLCLFMPISLFLKNREGLVASVVICGCTVAYLISIQFFMNFGNFHLSWITATLRAICQICLIVYPAMRVRVSLTAKYKNLGSGFLVIYYQLVNFICAFVGNYIYPVFSSHKNSRAILILTFAFMSILAGIGFFLVFKFERGKARVDRRMSELRDSRRKSLESSDGENKTRSSRQSVAESYVMAESLAITAQMNVSLAYLTRFMQGIGE